MAQLFRGFDAGRMTSFQTTRDANQQERKGQQDAGNAGLKGMLRSWAGGSLRCACLRSLIEKNVDVDFARATVDHIKHAIKRLAEQRSPFRHKLGLCRRSAAAESVGVEHGDETALQR